MKYSFVLEQSMKHSGKKKKKKKNQMCVCTYVYCSEIHHIPFTDVSAANVNRMMFKHVGFFS